MVSPIQAAVPNTAQSLNEDSESLGTYHFVVDLGDALFSVPVDPQSQDQLA